MVELGEVLELSLDPERVDPRATYPTLGVYGFGRGVITSKPPVQGSEIAATVLHRVHAGQFIYSKLKAFEGAFAVVPSDGDGRFVSNEFPTFCARSESLDTQYLGWLFRVPSTWGAVSSDSVGIGARREPAHHGKVASHRYLTCVADQRRLLPGVLWFFLQARDGLAQIQAASPGSADRNRTLAQDRLEAILVPVPPLDAQQRFEELRMKAKAVRALNAAAAEDAAALLPAMLHQTFSLATC